MSSFQIEKILTEQSRSKLYTYLKKQSVDLLATVAGYDPLDQLNPTVHSLGYLFILCVHATSPSCPASQANHRKSRLERPAKGDSASSLTQRIAIFLQDFDAKQIKAAPAECNIPTLLIYLFFI